MTKTDRTSRIAPFLGAMVAVFLISASPLTALAHGGSSVTVKEPTATPGGAITVSGDGLGEKGDTVTITLRGASFEKVLGTAILGGDTGDSFDGQRFTVPAEAPPGTYVVEARNGPTTATAQIDVMAASGGMTASAAPAGASAAIAPARPPLEWEISAALVILVALLAATLLWRSREELTAIDV